MADETMTTPKKTTTRKRPHWSAALVKLEACSEAVDWATTQPTYAKAWEACTNPDWILWLYERTLGKRSTKPMVLAACDIAETVLKHVTPGEDRPRKAIEVTRAWCAGKATQEEVGAARAASDAARAAASDAASAASDAACDAASAAAWAAASAAWAARAAAWAAASDAARAAAWDAVWAARDAAWAAQDAESCRLIRLRCKRPALTRGGK
jgi:hypothetical protein